MRASPGSAILFQLPPPKSPISPSFIPIFVNAGTSKYTGESNSSSHAFPLLSKKVRLNLTEDGDPSDGGVLEAVTLKSEGSQTSSPDGIFSNSIVGLAMATPVVGELSVTLIFFPGVAPLFNNRRFTLLSFL